MKVKKNHIYIWLISMIILFGIFLGNFKIAKAASTDVDLPVVNSPEGLNFSDYFIRGDTPSNNSNTTHFSNGDTSIVQITDALRHQAGYVWSNPDNLNYFNLKEKQTLSMWLYLGNAASPGDGLAFVLQNYGFDAMAKTATGAQANGESMGVWAPDLTYKNDTTPSDMASRGIQNSWAMEFDTFENNNGTGASLFKEGVASDANYNGNSSFDSLLNINSMYAHIAYNYPGKSTTYEQHSDSTANNGGGIFTYRQVEAYWYTMNHLGLKKTSETTNKPLSLSNNMWHHLVISYQPPVSGDKYGYLSYKFDDEVKSADPTVSPIKQPVSDSQIKIDTDNFYSNPTQKFTKDDGKVLWGFTGSTGTSMARNMVIFESIPSLVEGSASAKIYDDSQSEKELTSTDDTVYNGDNLRFVYNIKRDSGELDWKDINASINLPDNMTYSGGSITYSDGTTEGISATDISNNTLTRKLKDLLKSGDPNSATITINGTTNSDTPATDKDVSSTKAIFDGTDLIKDADLQGFTIKATTMKLVADSTNLDLGAKSSIDATSTVSYVDTNTSMDNSKFTAHYKLNDNDEKIQTLSNGTDGKVSINVSKTDLNDGNNTLVVYVTDSSGNRSNSVTYTINKPTKAPILVDADSDMSFRTVHTDGKTQIIKRKGSWKLNVIDNDGTANWKLGATAVQAADSSIFNGDLLYVDNTGATQSILNGSNIQIADKTTFPANFIVDGTYQVGNTWDNDDGMMLKSNSNVKAGNYKYNVTWNLTDSL